MARIARGRPPLGALALLLAGTTAALVDALPGSRVTSGHHMLLPRRVTLCSHHTQPLAASRRALLQGGAALFTSAALQPGSAYASALEDETAWLPMGLYTGATPLNPT
eukprot:scaffold136277_cov31-Tisochrysis_lutea.AAC.5